MRISKAKLPGYFLEKDSGISGQIKQFQWNQTALGAMETWPHSLLSALDSMMNAGFPMFLVWGEQSNFFFNDAFDALLETKQANQALKTHAAEIWPSLWISVQPYIKATQEGKPTNFIEELYIPVYRNGLLENAYWNLSYQRIKDEDLIKGIVFTIKETTQKLQLQKEAIKAQKQLRFALDACDLGTWDLDPVTMAFNCNKKTKEIFGFSKEESIDLPLAIDIIDTADRQRVNDAIANALQLSSGGHYDITYTVVHPVAARRTIVRARGKAYFDNIGQPMRFTGTLQDVTVEELSRRRKEKLQQLVESSKDYMSMATLEGQMTYLNPAGRSLVGLEGEQDLSVLKMKDFYSEEQFATVTNEIIPALGKDGYWSGFVKIKHQQTGKQIPCFANYVLVKDPVTGHIISSALTLKDLRPELVARKELEDSEKRFRNLVQEAPVATAIYIGREMKIQWANDAMIKLWGKDKSVIGTTVRAALPELEGQPFHQLLDDVYTTGEIYQATEDRGDLVVDGVLQTFYFNFSYKPLRDTEGRVYGILNMAIDVTEQVKTKRKLEESEKNFRNLIMQAPVGICLLTGDNFIVEVANDQYMELVARDRESFEHKPIVEVLPEAKEQGFDVLLNNVKKSGKPFFGSEYPVVLSRNGKPETFFLNFVYEPLFDENGEANSILVIVIDITQQVKARQLVEDAEERARLAVTSAKLGTYEFNFEAKTVIGSPRFRELFDVEESGERLDFVSKIHPDDLPVREAAHDKALVTGSLEYECRVNKRDGSTSWLQIFGQYYFNEQNEPYKIVGIVQDITEQKTVEEEREKFLSLSHYSQDFIGMCDMQMKTLYVNRAGLEMLGVEGDYRQASLWDCFYEEDHQFLRNQFFPRVIREGHGEVEIRFKHFKTGVPVWMIYSVFVIHNSKGEPSVLATVSRDITERKNMEAELERRVKERTAELEKLNDELQQFTYVSSHDLKEPLRKIRIFADMAEKASVTNGAGMATYLNKMKLGAERMSGLLTDLLNYSMLSNRERSYEMVDMNRMLEAVREDMELVIEEKKAVIESDSLPVVEGIPFQLNQLIYNLLSNALKFNKPGEAPYIEIRSHKMSEVEMRNYKLNPNNFYYQIDFIDNGIGFREEYADKIFVVFQRLHDREQYSGNGIGLSLCKKIMENHRGKIIASSIYGQGSTFSIMLPEQSQLILDSFDPGQVQ